MEHRKSLLIAHRGESYDAPENTHAAFDLAWQRGCQAIELDVHVTSDGEVVVCHDRDTLRTSGVQHVIRETPLRTLRSLDVGTWKAPRYAGERMATLGEVLGRVPVGKRVFVEMKSGVESVDAVMEVLRAYQNVDVVVISFNREVVSEVRRRGGHEVLWLVSPRRDEATGQWRPTPAEMIADATAIADGLDVDANSPIDQAFVDAAKSAGLRFYVWTVDDPVRAKALIESGVDGVTTNRAAWMNEQLQAHDLHETAARVAQAANSGWKRQRSL